MTVSMQLAAAAKRQHVGPTTQGNSISYLQIQEGHSRPDRTAKAGLLVGGYAVGDSFNLVSDSLEYMAHAAEQEFRQFVLPL